MSEKLTKVLDLLIAEDREEAAKALNEWFAEQQAAVTAQLMEADESEEELDESVTITIDTDDEAEVAQPVAEADGVASHVLYENDFEFALKFESQEDGLLWDEIFTKYGGKEMDDTALGDDDLEAAVAGSEKVVPAGALAELADAIHGAEGDGVGDNEGTTSVYEAAEAIIAPYKIEYSELGIDEAADADVDGDEAGDDFGGDESAVEDLTVDERVEDLEAQLEALRAEFAALMGDEAEDDAGEDAGEEGEEEIVDGDSDEEETEGDDEVEEAIAPGVPGKKTTFTQKSGIDFGGHQRIREDEEAFDDLAESADHHLEPVAAEKLKTEGETTGVGKKVKVSKDSPIPQRKPDERAGGDPVEIKGKTHKGYAREAAPTVLGGNEKFKNSQKAPKKISKEGDKSAELNKGPKEDKGKSPISGDPKLRGRDLSRKS